MIGFLISASNATLSAFNGKKRFEHASDPEFKSFIGLTAVGILCVTLLLTEDGFSFGSAIRNASFNVVTLATSGGYGNALGTEKQEISLLGRDQRNYAYFSSSFLVAAQGLLLVELKSCVYVSDLLTHIGYCDL